MASYKLLKTLSWDLALILGTQMGILILLSKEITPIISIQGLVKM
jgi:hypothetical protein